MKDWSLIARGYGVQISTEDLNKVAESLERVEAAFRPLTREIPLETEPAFVTFRLPEKPE
jgi:hypothetical protein